MVYARNIRFEIHPGKDQEFRTLFSTEVLPLLKKQEGFRDEVLMLKDHQGVGISLWKSREALDKYTTAVYPEVSKKLMPLLKGQPTVEVYEVTGGTINLN